VQSKQRYAAESNVLITRFLSDSASAEVIDFMPLTASTQKSGLVRMVRVIHGRIPFRLTCQPAFDQRSPSASRTGLAKLRTADGPKITLGHTEVRHSVSIEDTPGCRRDPTPRNRADRTLELGVHQLCETTRRCTRSGWRPIPQRLGALNTQRSVQRMADRRQFLWHASRQSQAGPSAATCRNPGSRKASTSREIPKISA
jgi:hypothetical protein